MQDRPVKYLELCLVGVVALVLFVAVLVGSDDGKDNTRRGAEGQTTEASESRVNVPRIVGRVEHLRSLRFRRRLKVTFATPAQARKLLSEKALPRKTVQRLRIDEEELKLLGLLPLSTDLQQAFEAVEREEVLGFYDQRSKRLVVIRGEQANRALLELTLAHELTHALEDQHFGLRIRRGLSDDTTLSRNALFEGTATVVMADYASRYLKLGDLLGVLGSLAGTGAELPSFIEDSLLFPYDAGERFVGAVRERGWRSDGAAIRGWQAVNQVFHRLPRSTEQIFHPEKYVLREPGAKLRATPLRSTLGRGWRRVDVTSVGEFDLGELFSVVGKVRSRRPATGWNGGRLELWRANVAAISTCPAPCIDRDLAVIRLAWDSRKDRLEGEAALRRVFQRGLHGKRLSFKDGRVGLWSSRGGAILMAGGSNQSDVVFAPDARLGARVLLRLVR